MYAYYDIAYIIWNSIWTDIYLQTVQSYINML